MFSEFDRIFFFNIPFFNLLSLTLFYNIFFNLFCFEVFPHISLLLLYSVAFILYFLIRLSISMCVILFS